MFVLELTRIRAKNAGLLQLMVAAMMIPVIFYWMVLPCFHEVRTVVLGNKNLPRLIAYGEVMGWRLAYPLVLLLHSVFLLHFSIGIVDAAEKGETKEAREQLYTAAVCFSIQRVVGNWEKANFLGCSVFAAMYFNSFLESQAFMCLWFGWALWVYVRFQLTDRVRDLVIELEKTALEN